MKHQRHFESATIPREVLQIGELIADLDRIVQILNRDLAAEEEQARVLTVPSQSTRCLPGRSQRDAPALQKPLLRSNTD